MTNEERKAVCEAALQKAILDYIDCDETEGRILTEYVLLTAHVGSVMDNTGYTAFNSVSPPHHLQGLFHHFHGRYSNY